MVNDEQYFEQNLNDFLEHFSLKKVQTSYFGRLRAPAVHGVSTMSGSCSVQMIKMLISVFFTISGS